MISESRPSPQDPDCGYPSLTCAHGGDTSLGEYPAWHALCKSVCLSLSHWCLVQRLEWVVLLGRHDNAIRWLRNIAVDKDVCMNVETISIA